MSVFDEWTSIESFTCFFSSFFNDKSPNSLWKKLSNCNKIKSLALGTRAVNIFNLIKCLNVTAAEFENYSWVNPTLNSGGVHFPKDNLAWKWVSRHLHWWIFHIPNLVRVQINEVIHNCFRDGKVDGPVHQVETKEGDGKNNPEMQTLLMVLIVNKGITNI